MNGERDVDVRDPIEELFFAATSDAGALQAFYAALLDATVFALVPGRHLPERIGFYAFKGDRAGTPTLAFFSSMPKAVSAGIADSQVVSMRARTFMELTRGNRP